MGSARRLSLLGIPMWCAAAAACHPAPNAAPPPSLSDEDSDGIPDAEDTCPAAAEDFNGFDDDDGCPDADQLARVPHDEDRIPPVRMPAAGEAFDTQSLATLDRVALVLREFPGARLELRGYAADAEQSRACAEAVKRELVERGVDAARLTLSGAVTPLDANEGPPNRWVEFVLLANPQ